MSTRLHAAQDSVKIAELWASRSKNPGVKSENTFYTDDIKPNIDELFLSNSSKKSDKADSFAFAGLTALTMIAAFATSYVLKKSVGKKVFDSVTSIKPQSFRGTIGKTITPEFMNKYVNRTRNCDIMAKIKPKYNPETLDVAKWYYRTLDASNFSHPHGTIAIPSTLGESLSTSGLLQCSALAVVDKKHNLQTLIHCCPTVKGNESLLKYVFSHSKSADLEITLVPGFYKETDATVDFLVNSVKKYAPDAKLTFANFPDTSHDVLILRNGVLKCCSHNKIFPTVNPADRIVHA